MAIVLTWFVPAAALVVGFALLAIGWRGRRVDDHPLCRKCGRDLFGIGELSGRCPECGRALAAAGAIRHGNRQRRTGMFGAGLAMVIPAVLWIGGLATMRVASVDVNRYKPATWLAASSLTSGAATQDPALRELMRRIEDGEMSASAAGAVADCFMERQAALEQAWQPKWGDFVERAREKQLLDSVRWDRYLRQGVILNVEFRPRVRHGAVLVYSIPTTALRMGSPKMEFTDNGLWIEMVPRELRFGDRVVRTGSEQLGSSAQSLRSQIGGFTTGLGLDGEQWEQNRPGRTSIGLTLDAVVREGPDGPIIWDRTEEFDADIEIVPADVPTVTLVSNPALETPVASAIAIARPHPADVGLRFQAGQGHLALELTSMPCGVAFEAFVDDGKMRRPLGSLAVVKGETTTYHLGHYPSLDASELDPWAGFDAERVRLILVPSIRTAENTIHLTEIWGGEVVLEDVPVLREPPRR